jgi:hypothetical protein
MWEDKTIAKVAKAKEEGKVSYFVSHSLFMYQCCLFLTYLVVNSVGSNGESNCCGEEDGG